MRSPWPILGMLVALAAALLLRIPDLGGRPLHNDESVNALKLAALWERGEYRYDPHEYHGPTLHYFSLPFLAVSRASGGGPEHNSHADSIAVTTRFSDANLRLVTAAFGVALIGLLLLLRAGLGPTATLWAAWLLAVSPAFVFYSRYFIHEMLLVFFTLLTLATGWRYWQSRRAGWAGLTGAGMGLMFATKETFVLTLAALIFALGATRVWERWRARRADDTGMGARTQPEARGRAGRRVGVAKAHVVLALAVAGVVWLTFFTSFFTNAAGPVDSFTTYLPWLNRAGGASPHIHPWYFYFERLIWFHPAKSPPWTEALILVLAVIGAAAGFGGNRARVPQPGLVRFLSFFTVALAGIYSVISYKTPWCALNFWLGFVLLAGVGAQVLVNSMRAGGTRLLLVGLLGIGCLHLAMQAWFLSRPYNADLRNPYVYAQTAAHERLLTARVKAITRVAPEGRDTVVKVIAPESYWPLPWTLRELARVGWYEALPDDPLAPIVICSAKLNAALDEKTEKRWIMTGYYELRPNVFFELYVERKLWEQFVAVLPRGGD